MFSYLIRTTGAPQMLRTAAALLLGMVICAGGTGCAHKSDPNAPAPSASRSKQKDTLKRTEPADPFDIGAGRKPTPDTMFALAKIMAARDQQTESMGILRNIISQYPNYLPAYNGLAEAHIQIGQSDEAIDVLKTGLKRAPNDPVLLNNMGMAHFLREEYADALPSFEKAAELRPEVPLYRANKAAALGMLGRSREARLEYRQILSAKYADENVEILERARRRPGAKPVAASEPEAAPTPTPTPTPTPAPTSAVQQPMPSVASKP
jgi:tetratricopeptide (TPR) repeat protein